MCVCVRVVKGVSHSSKCHQTLTSLPSMLFIFFYLNVYVCVCEMISVQDLSLYVIISFHVKGV